jgi:predicted nucleic acid-binding protein
MFVDPGINYLLDTNVISDYRKGVRAHPGVKVFFEKVESERIFLPVQVIGEIQAGITRAIRKNDRVKVRAYTDWLDALVGEFIDRIIDFDLLAARTWGLLLSSKKNDSHTIDKQIAAIAISRGMVVVTGDKGEAFSKTGGVAVLNPFHYDPTAPPSQGKF